MASAKTQPARGMRDFLPEDVRRREYVIGVIKEVYERYGFEPLETPAVENIETLMGKYGEEGNQLIFKILKRGVHESTGEADLALRYDLTVPLARVVAEYRDKLPKFFKRYQIQPVWRADRPARGRFREFYQCDVDVLGSRSMVVEVELIAAASEALTKLGFDDFQVRLNNRLVLEGILKHFGVAEERKSKTLVALDKLDKIGADKVVKELLADGENQEIAGNLIGFFAGVERSFRESSGDPSWNHRTILALAATAAGLPYESLLQPGEQVTDQPVYSRILTDLLAKVQNEDFARGMRELVSILTLAERTNADNRIRVDFSLARGLSYYTGTIMEMTVPDLPGSLGGGGRYDNLVGMFLDKDVPVPACGFSLGLERIIVVMTERTMFPPQVLRSPADVLVTIWNEDSIRDSLSLAHQLRAAGLRVDLYPEPEKLGKQFKYAAARRIPVVAVIGEDEQLRGEIAIKEMNSGEQQSLKFNDAVAVIQSWKKSLDQPAEQAKE